MGELTKTDLHFVMSRVPRDVREMMQKNPAILLGGGFIRSTIAGERASDIDLFGPDPAVTKLVAMQFALERKARIHETKNAITILCPPRIPVQFITRWSFENIQDTCDSFDFTICQAALCWGGDKWVSVCSDGFYPDLAARRLRYTFPKRSEEAGGSLLRVRKFLSRGYSIQAPSLAGVVARLVASLEFEKMEDYRREEWVAKILTGKLREVDPLAIVDGVDAIDEHEIQ